MSKTSYSSLLPVLKSSKTFSPLSQKEIEELLNFAENYKYFNVSDWFDIQTPMKRNEYLNKFIAQHPDISPPNIIFLLDEKAFTAHGQMEILKRNDMPQKIYQKIVNNSYPIILNAFVASAKDDEQLSQKTMDTILEILIENTSKKESQYKPQPIDIYVLEHTHNFTAINTIISDQRLNDKLYTAIINNKSIPEKTRDYVASLGYVPQMIKYPTTELMKEIYESAVETVLDDELNKQTSYVAQQTLCRLIEGHYLTDEQEVDLTMKLTSMPKLFAKKPCATLETLILNSDNDNVFNIYMCHGYSKGGVWGEILYSAKNMSNDIKDTLIIRLLDDIVENKKQFFAGMEFNFILKHIQNRRMHPNTYKAILETLSYTINNENTSSYAYDQIGTIAKITAFSKYTPNEIRDKMSNEYNYDLSGLVLLRKIIDDCDIPYVNDEFGEQEEIFEWKITNDIYDYMLGTKTIDEFVKEYPKVIDATNKAIKEYINRPHFEEKRKACFLFHTELHNLLFNVESTYANVQDLLNNFKEERIALKIDNECKKDVFSFLKNIDKYCQMYSELQKNDIEEREEGRS